MNLNEYRDKVLGCWLGKCVTGTLGAPYEGIKQSLDIKFEPSMIEEMLPNDDLDLQVLWLDALERKGVNVSSEDLAEVFYEKNIKWPGEYAYFRKNYERGIRPPYSGIYENDFYRDGLCLYSIYGRDKLRLLRNSGKGTDGRFYSKRNSKREAAPIRNSGEPCI